MNLPAIGLRRILRLVLTAIALAVALQPASVPAGVLQVASVEVSGVRDSESVFGASSTDVTQDIFASVTNFNPPPGFPSGFATASVSRFGSVGVSLGAFNFFDDDVFFPGAFAQVVVGSDEFVNLTGVPRSVVAKAIIDGGRFQVDAASNVRMSLQLTLSAANLGPVDLESDLNAFDSLLSNTNYDTVHVNSIRLEADQAGNFTFLGDLGAVFTPGGSPGIGTVDIPLSLQSFDLGTLGVGDRLLIEYVLSLDIENDPFENGLVEGAFIEYSDPLALSGNPAFTVQFASQGAAVPEPGGLALLSAGGLALLAQRRRRRKRAVN